MRAAEAMMHDPDLYRLAKQIEASMGSGTRFMLRILIEAPNEEKCLLAMLRFTQAARRKKYLVGPVEEEEL